MEDSDVQQIDEQELTVMFADIVGSTRLYDRLGDIEARFVISQSLEVASDLVSKHNGRIIKSTGDDVMCVFDDPNDALHAACSIQDNFLDKMVFDEVVISFHIGVHSGKGIVTDNDIYGDTVNIAARLTDAAKSGQVLASEYTVQLLGNDLKNMARRYDTVKVKGKSEKVEMYDFVWNTSGEETGLIEFLGWEGTSSLHLTVQQQELLVPPESNSVFIGRDQNVGLKVIGKMVSRKHAVIDYRHGKFVLRDQSTNGTYVKIGDGEEVFIKNEEFPLSANGIISLGKTIDDKPGLNIEFEHQEPKDPTLY